MIASYRRKVLRSIAGMGMALMTLVGCKQKNSDEQVQARDVQREVSQAAKTTGQYADQKKDQFIASMQQGLDSLQKDIKDLGDKTQSLSADAKQEAQQTQAKLQDQYDKLKEKMASLKDASKDSWEEVKTSISKGLDDLKQGIKDAKTKFNP